MLPYFSTTLSAQPASCMIIFLITAFVKAPSCSQVICLSLLWLPRLQMTSLHTYVSGHTGYTQNNGAVSMVNKGKPHHSFVYTLYIQNKQVNCLRSFQTFKAFQKRRKSSRTGIQMQSSSHTLSEQCYSCTYARHTAIYRHIAELKIKLRETSVTGRRFD
jgi:hypothetical protein